MPAIAPTNKAKSKKANNLVTMSPDVSRSVEGKDRKKKQVKSTFEAKKMSKKRKTVDEQEEESSDTTSDSAKLALLNQKAWVNGSVPKKPRIAEESNDEDDDDEGELTGSGEEDAGHEDPNALSNFRISKVLMEKLKSRGIKALFPIQAMTFNIIFEGSDLVGRARTGQGKTLAFVLPILESLTNGQHKVSKKTGYGRTPSVLVLLPTRELANQVHTDFEIYGGSLGLSSCCLYGGAPYRPQESALKRGVDIVIGTPGRIKDHIERGTLNLMSLKFRVLDEADEMLNMGFVDDVELILGKVGDVSKVQTLLFSATLPDWVKKIATRFQKPTKKTVDLVGNEKLKASASVQHVVIPCSSEARPRIIPDLISCYSRGGRSIIFTETRESASKLSGSLPGSRALHGDIVQAQREVIISGFRSGKLLVLVATNVAARGLDINDVQLIIQCEPPRDVEAYIHRSGRTGRAGNTGVAILLYDPRYSHYVSKIEKQSGVKFEHMSAPQTSDIAKTAGSDAADAIMKVSDSVITIFRSQAEELQKKSGLSPADLLAKALAKASGCSEIKKRSILTSLDDYVTLHLDAGKQLFSPTFVFSILKRFMSEEKIGGIKHLSITADSMGAVFDVPADYVSSFIEGQKNANMVNIKVLQKVPPLQERESNASFGGGGRRFGVGGGRFGGRGRGSGGFGGKSSGFSGRGRANSGSRNRFNRN